MPSVIGIHCIRPDITLPLVRKAKERGARWKLVKGVDNGGVAIDVKAVDPLTLTITRFVNEKWDSFQNGENWTAAEGMRAAFECIQLIFDRTNEDERRAADWFEVVNEADPPGVIGWRAYGYWLKVLVGEANRRGVKLCLPAFNFGTPEWTEMVAFTESGLFGLMKAGGHILSIHEGVDPFTDDAFATGSIPDAPFVPGAGPVVYRYRYLYHLLKQRGEVVPLVVSEFYTGGGYNWDKREMIVGRMKSYDQEVRKDDYVLAVLPFTVDPSPGWMHQNYNPFYPSVLDYVVAEKDKVDMAEVKVADSSMYQCRFLGDPNSAADRYNPDKWVVDWDWEAVRNSEAVGFIVRIGIGLTKDPVADRIIAGLKSIDKLWAIYHAYDPSKPAQAQADKIRQWCSENPPMGVWGDLEMGNAVFQATNDYLEALDRHYNRPTGIYSGGPYMDSHFTQSQQRLWRGRPTWWAGYPNFITPSGWTAYIPTHHLHQFTDSYILPGVPRRIDMSRLNSQVALDVLIKFFPLTEVQMAIFFTLRNMAPELADQVERHIQELFADAEQNGRCLPYGQPTPPPAPQPLYRAEVLYNVTLRDGAGSIIPYTTGQTFVPRGTIVEVWEEFDLSPTLPNRALISREPNRPNIVRSTTVGGPALRRLP